MNRPYFLVKARCDDGSGDTVFVLLQYGNAGVSREGHHAMCDEIQQWCAATMGEEGIRWQRTHTACFVFDSVSDAALFKLTWG